MNKCPKCNAEVQSTDKFCMNCGASLQGLVADKKDVEADELNSQKLKGKNGAKKYIGVGIVLVAVLLGALILVIWHHDSNSSSNAPEKKVTTQSTKTGTWSEVYPETISQYETQHGNVKLFHPMEDGPYYLIGLIDARLFDFNDDNTPELVLMFSDPSDSFTLTEDGIVEEKGHFFYDVWQMKEGHAEKVFTGEPTYETYELGHVYLDFVSVGQVYCLSKTEQDSDWDYSEYYYGFDGNKFKELYSSRCFREDLDVEEDTFNLNGKTVPEEEWNEWYGGVALHDEVFYQAEENAWDEAISKAELQVKIESIAKVKEQCEKGEFSGNEADLTSTEEESRNDYYPSGFSFYNLFPYTNENGECILLEIEDYDTSTGTVIVGEKPQAFVLGNGLLKTVDYETDLSGYVIHRGPYSYQVQSDNAVSVMGYGQEVRGSTKIGTNGYVVDLYYTVYANPHENYFVTLSELDLNSVEETTIDNTVYHMYKVK